VEEAWQAAGKMLTYWLLLLAVLLLVAFVAAPALMPLLAPGFGAADRQETLELSRVLLLMAAPLGAGRILAVVLHAERRFFVAGLAEVAFQVGSTAILVALHDLGVMGLAWAQAAGGCLFLLVSALGLRGRRARLQAGFDLHSRAVRRLIRLNLPVYLADSGDKLNQIVTRAIASLFRPGAVSSLQYAFIPIEGAYRTLAVPLTTALFPFLSNLFAQGDPRRARARLGRAIVATALVFLPLSAALWLLADPLVVLLFERGRFDKGSTSMTAAALRLFAPAVVALALNELIGAAFHARQDTITPMRAGFVRVVFHVVLSAVISRHLGYRGLALSATLALYVKLGVLWWSMRAFSTAAETRRLWRALARVLLASAAMFALMYPVVAFASTLTAVQNHALRSLCGGGLVCVAVYALTLWVFARRELFRHLGLARRTLGRYWRRSPTPALAPGLAARGEGG
jgi:putative peptidoglycan lipid II flippase